MKIWFATPTLESISKFSADSLISHLGIEFLELGDDFIRAKMPVDRRTVQPAGILHGGASVSLAETLGSLAATLCVDTQKKRCVGLEINANHIRPVSNGYVYGVCRPIHMGNTTQIWEIKISNEQEKLVCIARLTLAVILAEM